MYNGIEKYCPDGLLPLQVREDDKYYGFYEGYVWRNRFGELHRGSNLPASVHYYDDLISIFYMKDGSAHRTNGPAIIDYEPSTKDLTAHYFIEGNSFEECEYFDHLYFNKEVSIVEHEDGFMFSFAEAP